jgi:hypothetical protein
VSDTIYESYNLKRLLIILFTVHCLLFTVYSLRAQVIKGALIGGFNLSQVDGDQVYGFHKFGINAGASAIIPLKNRFSIALEILYSQKGSFQSTLYPYADSTGKYKLRLNYAEVPVLIQYNDKGGFTFSAGMSYGRLVHVAEEQYNRKDKKIEWDNVHLNDGTYKNDDFEILGDLRVRLYEGFYFNARYSYSMAKIRTRYFYSPFNFTRKQYNNFLSFRVIWVINDKKIEEKINKRNEEQME